MANFSNILIPIDFTECSIAILPYARLMAEKFSAQLHLFYSLAGPEQFEGLSFKEDWFSTYGRILKVEAEKAMENFIEKNMKDMPPPATAIRVGETVEEILAYSDKKNIDLILMASHDCHRSEKRIYGSIAETVSRKVKCPVMIIHPE